MKNCTRNILRLFTAHFALIVLAAFLLASCVKEDFYDNTKRGNYEALWRIMNENYCFFDYKKQELGVDWDEIHARYSYKINEKMTKDQLFEVLAQMLSELQDGHVNLSASFDFGRNWSFFENYPENYNDSIAKLYLGHNYRIASGLKYTSSGTTSTRWRCAHVSPKVRGAVISKT